MNKAKKQELARTRASIIMKVRSGQMTAREGAEALGVSRKTYYEWEQRALEAMVAVMDNGAAGRPAAQADTEKQQLQARVKELEKKLLLAEKTIEVRDLLAAFDEQQKRGDKKKKSSRRRRQKQC
jgi:transposase